MNNLHELQQFNFNLILPLKALLDHRNVSHAAEALNLTQSTMSRHLANLREFFDDPLLVRIGVKYVLTPRGTEIHKTIDVLVADLANLLSNEFNPSTCRLDFHFSAPDYVGNYVMSEVLAPFTTRENLLTIHLHNWDNTARDMLLNGDLHLAISLDDAFPQNIYRRIIDEDRMVCVARPDHPVLTGDSRELEHLDELDFVIVSTGGGRCKPIDTWLADHGTSRRIKMTVPGYDTAFFAIAKSDLVAIVPQHVTRGSVAACGLKVLPVPTDVPLLRYSLWWHERYNKDSAHCWLRKQLFPRILACPNQLGLSYRD